MRQSRSPRAERDRRLFPIRLRVRVPEGGFGRQLDEMYVWLKKEAGPDGYAIHAAMLPGIDAVAIYLNDPALVKPLIEAHGLELVQGCL